MNLMLDLLDAFLKELQALGGGQREHPISQSVTWPA
jgi:hypothetical protein